MKILLFGVCIICGLVLVWGGADLGSDATRVLIGIATTSCIALMIFGGNKDKE